MDTSTLTDNFSRWLLLIITVVCFTSDSSDCHILRTNTPMCNYKFLQKFLVYWNVPTDECLKYDVSFADLQEDFCIIQNTNDKFRGDRVVILYDPGSFPTLKNDYDQDLFRNGGVPQRGNLTLHLEDFRRDVDKWIPDANYSGIAIIDFELWRPIFRQLWGKYVIYRDLSIKIEKQKHPNWNNKQIIEEASKNFEEAAKMFVLETLKFAQALRPHARWGYYDYPFCNNWSSSNKHDRCPDTIVRENDQMSWLYKNISLLMPSVYLSQDLKVEQRVGLVRGRVREAVRLANKWSDRQNVKVLPYYWYRYRKNNTFIEKTELESTLSEIKRNGGDGVVIWGMRDDINSKSKCEDFYNFVHEILGPIILNIKVENNDS